MDGRQNNEGEPADAGTGNAIGRENRFRAGHFAFHTRLATRAEGAISKLFSGKIRTSTKCVNLNYKETTVDEFYGKKYYRYPRE